MDILQATLAAGIMVKRYVPSYGDQPNDVQHVVKYFRDKFRGYHVSRIRFNLSFCCFCYFFFKLFELFWGCARGPSLVVDDLLLHNLLCDFHYFVFASILHSQKW